MTTLSGHAAQATTVVTAPPITAQDVAVIIVNFNGGEYLIRCLQALLELAEQPGEIIIVDNASEDGSAAAAVAQFPTIRLIDAGSNTGFAAANNIGIAATDRPWIGLINPDAYVESGWMTAILSAANSNPGIHFFQPS